MDKISVPLLRFALLGVFPSLLMSLTSALASAQVTYRLTDLGTLGGSESYGRRINASGQVTGDSLTPGDVAMHAFMWDGITMRDLGTFGGSGSGGIDINASGQVIGYSFTSGNLADHAFFWDGTTMRDLGTLGGTHSHATAINNAGQVTGGAYPANDCQPVAFLWNGTEMQNLDPLGINSYGNDINDSGQVVGTALVGQMNPEACESGYPIYWRALLWNGKTTQELGTLGGRSSWAVAINASGQVIGSSEWDPTDVSNNWNTLHAFLWDGSMRDLGTLGGKQSIASAINDSGHVTGWSYTSGNTAIHAFLWDGITMRDLGVLGSGSSFAYDLNRSGQVIGGFATEDDSVQGVFLWDGTTMRNLDEVIDPADPLQPFVTLVQAYDINDQGQIVANGIDSRTAKTHAYLVSPIVAPYAFDGFFSPVDNTPTTNLAKAGSAIPVKFSLGGDKGLYIFATGYPISRRINCETSAPVDAIEETVTAGSSELSYASGTDQYHYVWKTDASWAGTCRQLIVRLNDLTEHIAYFEFK